MEQDGGTVPAARIVAAHQPERPPALSSSVSAAGQRDFITLAQPRPGLARRQNEYVETPIRPQLPSSKSSKCRLKDDHGNNFSPPREVVSSAGANQSGLPGVHRPYNSRTANVRQGLFSTPLPITAQPTVATLKKEKLPDSVSNGSDVTDDQHNDSIICRQCRRCKCEACRSPKKLPSKWICNDKCLCSASSIVDYCSCMCCVKGIFYHWAKDYEMDNDVSCADQPCSCSPHQRFLRWGCLGVLSLALPCLCFYWPLRGCVRMCETCYTHCYGQGCQCTQPHRTAVPIEQAPEKRLLDSNSDF